MFFNRFYSIKETTSISVNMSKPGRPQNVRSSSYRGAEHLKIRWNEPATNAEYVTHYIVKYKKANDSKDHWHTRTTRRRNKLSAIVRGLKPDTDYRFCVQSANGCIDGETSESIEMDTRWSKAAKVFVTPAVVVGGALATPFAAGAAIAMTTWESIEPQNPVTGVLTGALSLFSGVLGAIASVVAAPVVGGFAARELHDERWYSSQSSEDE